MKMLDNCIICIYLLIQLYVSCLISSIHPIPTQRYASHNETVYTTDST